jgi:addiction module HigA family antidote
MTIDLPESWVSDLAIHPGEFLAEEIEARELTRSAIARRMSRPPRVVADIVAGRRDINARLAYELEAALNDISARYWLRLQCEFDLAREGLRRAALVTA